MKNIGWIILNLQLVVGFIYSYNYLHRHIIVHNVFLFIISVFLLSNVLFFLMRKLEFYSLRAFLSILASSFMLTLIFIMLGQDFPKFTFNSILIILAYINIRLLLFITTPIAMFTEVILYYKKKYYK